MGACPSGRNDVHSYRARRGVAMAATTTRAAAAVAASTLCDWL